MKHLSTLMMLIFLAGATTAAGETQRGLSIMDVERIVGRDGSNHYTAVLRTLEQRGYTIVEVSNTWLNRLRIWAENNVHKREVVVSRANGRILRDAVVETYARNGVAPQVIPVVPIEELLENHSGGIRIVPNP
ncbi:hypothetical protein [Roseinatronobacter sp. S2]|uniref:hypothetical protein n=1 Tax=Roseinatronobacter sp. S2 TaxID=3035471 RepID=UPI00240F9223|nr:hypothetical protein [Roseinatronobacter sp. S2]WFE76877.1 hypothetical protein P8S53_17690 [Roseinatronobacter sp. S2]